jgi:hypothetical protein
MATRGRATTFEIEKQNKKPIVTLNILDEGSPLMMKVLHR